MVSGTTDRRILVEQQLFEVYTHLSRARTELEHLEAELTVVAAAVEAAEVRLNVAETSRAEWVCCETRRRAHQLESARDAAALSIARLERTQDGLLSKLVG